MPLRIVRNDLTKMKVDAIVNAAGPSLLGGGGVDGMIHEAAGPQLLEACRKLGGCRPGEAKMTKGFLLPARYVIHTVGPVWQGGTQGEAGILADCYRNSLELAAVNRLRTVAFPLISAGTYGYPNAEALRVAVDTIAAWLMESEDMTVYLVVFSRSAYEVSSKLFSDVRVLIDDAYAARHEEEQVKRMRRAAGVLADSMVSPPPPMASGYAPSPKKKSASVSSRRNDDLGDLIRGADEGFSELLLHKIDERGMTDSECYKKANIDRRVFSKIRSRRDYRPSKSTACAFALALELSGSEADDFLARAGYALSTAQPFDIILRYCIDHHVFNVHEVNAVLFQYDQPLLGA